MSQQQSEEILPRVRTLAQMAAELRCGQSFSVTRLTTLKSLCQDPEVTVRFVTFLARKTLERVEQRQGHTRRRTGGQKEKHLQLMADAVAAMDEWLDSPSEFRKEHLWDLWQEIRVEQNEYENIPFGAVRMIHDWDLLLIEYALETILRPHESTYWGYQTARHYAERTSSRYAEGLTPASAPLVQDIADFWAQEAGIDPEAVRAPAPRKKKAARPPGRPKARRKQSAMQRQQKPAHPFTPRQGQFLAFIHWYTRLHRQPPAELDMVRFFRVTPPTVHGMVLKLHELGLITREPGRARTIRLAIPEDELPELENSAGPPI